MQITVSNRQVDIDEDDLEKFQIKGNFFNVTSHGYVRVLNYIDGKYKQTYLHRLITNAPKELQVDHINGNRLDNRKENLRLCTSGNNNKNRACFSGRYKGVHFAKKNKSWVAQITKDYKIKHLGTFATEEEAARAYNVASKELHGEYGYINCINN